MKVCATILLGPGSGAVVGEAIASVARHVDGFVLIESGGGPEALQAATESIEVWAEGRRVETLWTARPFQWTGSYSDARQCALEAAEVAGYDWALTVDPDERILLPENWRSTLEDARVHVLMLRDRDEGYGKERFLRCRVGLRWHGRVCENVLSPSVFMAAGTFWELPKTPEQNEARYRRGIRECHRMIHDECDDRFKWWRHMGTCYAGIGNHLEAERCYREAYARAKTAEDRAWSAYLTSELLVLREAYQEAHDMAARELALHAGFLPEFGWILAYTQSKMGDMQNAARWCQLVVSCPPDQTRVGNRGKTCRTGAGQLLSCLLAAQPIETLNGVDIPISSRFSARMRETIRAGVYEASEARMVQGLATPNDIVLDLGAGCGYLAALAGKRAAKVIAVEPDPEMAKACRNTFEANGIDGCVIEAAVHSGECATVRLRICKDFWSNSIGDDGIPVKATTLAALLAEHSPTVLICDIEGSERWLLGTALGGVRAVVIETHSIELAKAVDEWMTGEGLRHSRGTERSALYIRE